MTYSYEPTGVCPRRIDLDLEDGVVRNIRFQGGCKGNLSMLCKLLDGKSADEIVAICKGHPCKGNGTSCMDRLALAVEEAVRKVGT